jgi:hypothetical protein
VGAAEALFFHPGEVCLKDPEMIGLLRWIKASLEELEHTSMLAGRYYLDPVFPILLKVNENLLMNVMNRTSSHISFKNHMHHEDHTVVNTAEEQLEHGKATCDYSCHQNLKCRLTRDINGQFHFRHRRRASIDSEPRRFTNVPSQ